MAGRLGDPSPPLPSYHRLDAFREHEAVVERVDGVVWVDADLALEQDGARVEAVVRPKDREPALAVAAHQRPAKKTEASSVACTLPNTTFSLPFLPSFYYYHHYTILLLLLPSTILSTLRQFLPWEAPALIYGPTNL